MMDANDGVAANAANDDEYEVAVIDECGVTTLFGRFWRMSC
jgi:hypothetical protein